jgi:hypothetical protein
VNVLKVRGKVARALGCFLAIPLMLTTLGTMNAGASGWISEAYPLQAKAVQVAGVPSTMYWALLIGINDYASPTTDNIGSRQDAEALAQALVKNGWRTDHIITIKDRNATAAHIMNGISWLTSKTNSASTAVFEYAGHERWRSTTASTEPQHRDVELWAADNRNIVDDTLGIALGKVRAGHMWIDISTCRAAGFDDAGMIKNGRILTFSSTESELSAEDPRLHHSVFGWFMIVQAIINRGGDANGDGKVSVEEAFAYARPRVIPWTQKHQHPVMIDKFSGSFSLIPPPPT